MKKRVILVCIGFMAAIAASGLYLKWDAIFQKGDPVPYLMAAVKLSEETTYAPVGGQENVYISKRGDCPELFAFFEETKGVTFTDRLGSGYLFTNDTEGFIVSSEIYWGRYTLWTLPESGFPLDRQ